MTIGTLAQEAGVSVETVRYYQRVGLLEEPVKPANGYRTYPSEALEHLLFIRRAKNFGFSLSDIGALLKLGDSETSCESACALAEKNLQEIQARKRELEELEVQISKMLGRCTSASGCAVLGTLSGRSTP
ncbi:MAG: MerR family transcriptional regulator [Candidatus Eremiobacteraeota bacterium]|nr:MerR family transcriptional regulator [Candidatus Eremiobacteraeota bacterium]